MFIYIFEMRKNPIKNRLVVSMGEGLGGDQQGTGCGCKGATQAIFVGMDAVLCLDWWWIQKPTHATILHRTNHTHTHTGTHTIEDKWGNQNKIGGGLY